MIKAERGKSVARKGDCSITLVVGANGRSIFRGVALLEFQHLRQRGVSAGVERRGILLARDLTGPAWRGSCEFTGAPRAAEPKDGTCPQGRDDLNLINESWVSSVDERFP